MTRPSIIWEGDLKDDCTAKWEGLVLRAEWTDHYRWWWAVYDLRLPEEDVIDASYNHADRVWTGQMARSRAEAVARNYLEQQDKK